MYDSQPAMIGRWKCLGCGEVGTMKIVFRLMARPVRTHTGYLTRVDAGFRPEVRTGFKPVLVCRACQHFVVGDWNGEHYIVFPTHLVARENT